MGVLVLIATRNLIQARRRTALLSSAIGLVTALLILLLAMSQGIADNLVTSATTLSAGHVVVAGFYKPSPSQAIPLVTDAAKVRKVLQESTPDLDFIIARGRGWGKFIGPGGTVQSAFGGVTIADEPRFVSTLQLAQQSEYKEGGKEEILGDASRLSEPGAAILFVNQAKRLEVDVGDAITFVTETNDGRTNTIDLTVVAIARDMGMLSSWSVLGNMQTLRTVYKLSDDTTGAFWVYLKDIDRAEEVMNSLRISLAQAGFQLMDHQGDPFFFKFEVVAGEDWTGQKLDLTIWRDEVSFLVRILDVFNVVSVFIASVLLVIVAIGIINTMFNVVRERTREIGTMRAIGIHRRRVLLLFMIEATLLGLFATTLGALVGAALALGIDAAAIPAPIDAMKMILLADTIPMAVRPSTLAQVVVVLTAVTGLAAFWPAALAARLRPIVALGHTA
ncbi:MAG: ABC transporter permease [Myxococcales bacterium]|nr:ABC transporter permease [Myxococcales bacterium]